MVARGRVGGGLSRERNGSKVSGRPGTPCKDVDLRGPEDTISGLFRRHPSAESWAGTTHEMVGEQVRKYPMTPEGHAKLQATVRDLLEVQRPAAVKAIEVARAHGDLSENSEYDDAKERQGMIEARIRDYEAKLGLAEVIDPSMLSGNKVMFGAHVTVEDVDSDEILTYQLVGSEETDLKRGHISIESPIGRALLGREVDDEVNFNVPRGRRTVVVTEVEYK